MQEVFSGPYSLGPKTMKEEPAGPRWCSFQFLLRLKASSSSEEASSQSGGPSVGGGARVSKHPSLWRRGHFIQVTAVPAAMAGLDEHGGPPEALPIRAEEGHGHGAGAARQAAAPVRANAAVVGPVGAHAHALPVGQVDGMGGLLGWRAAPAFLRVNQKKRGEHYKRVSILFHSIEEFNSILQLNSIEN